VVGMVKIRSSEITPEQVYLSRRKFLRASASLLGTLALAACSASDIAPSPSTAPNDPTLSYTGKTTDERGTKLTSYDDVTHYNNYYEFSPIKTEVADLSQGLTMSPWVLQVGGLVSKPLTLGVDDLRKRYPPQDRIYRLRCVEGWSMVIPWQGFPLANLLRDAQPLSKANFVRFQSLLAPDQMPGQKRSTYPWPYVEGLRLPEAMHELTLLATGLYGKPLLSQNGGPVRLVVPWKYGYKSAKAIVKIDLVEDQPETFWVKADPGEYEFVANVNPKIPHPRWSQATERRIGEVARVPTLLYNGYTDQVASLYSGTDTDTNSLNAQ
jgi:sulfoxide reductase catalytic subunit YedY